MIKLNDKQSEIVKPFFDGTDHTLISSFLQGYMGEGWVDSINNPTCAQIRVGAFSFVAGNHKSDEAVSLVKNILFDGSNAWFLIIPQNDEWGNLIEKCYTDNSYKIKRYAFKRGTVFSNAKLQSFVDTLNPEYKLIPIDKKIYKQCQEIESFSNLCSQFHSAEDYMQRGIGFCILHDEKIVCGASSYSVYDKGIEIEIDTEEEYRRQGLGTVCAARLMLDCIEKGVYPNWDAANPKSLAMAEKLGYEFSFEYDAYAIRKN